MYRNKKLVRALLLSLLLCQLLSVSALATGSGDVASAVQSTWNTASGQIKNVVNNVVFPAIDLILVVFFFTKVGTSYFDYRKTGMFDWTGPAYIWGVIGI